MIKKDIVSLVGHETSNSDAFVEEVIDSFLRNIINAVANGDKVQFAGFGTFEPKQRAARTGRNPHTNEEVPIPACVVPYFRAGKCFKDAVTEETL